MAVATKTRSPQTIGVALPRPGSAAFHFMLVLSSHSSGGSPFGAVPLASGPRQWGQLSSFSAAKSPPRAKDDRHHIAKISSLLMGVALLSRQHSAKCTWRPAALLRAGLFSLGFDLRHLEH